MNKQTRALDAFRRNQDGDGRFGLTYPLAISLAFHLLVMVFVVFAPGLSMKEPPAPSVINVSMVSLQTPSQRQAAQSAPQREVQKTETKPSVRQTPAKSPAKEIPVAPKAEPKPKTSLKKKTFKSTEVVKHAIQELKERQKEKPSEKKDDAASPEQLKSAIERLREEVGKKETAKSASSAKESATKDAGGGKLGGFNEEGKRKAELVDMYRLEIAFEIQKHWAFNEALAGGDTSLMASIVFKVMPDGEIRDIFFTDRSGNAYLDESAYKAIVKASPVDPHPTGLRQPYVEMGIRFTPQGIR